VLKVALNTIKQTNKNFITRIGVHIYKMSWRWDWEIVEHKYLYMYKKSAHFWIYNKCVMVSMLYFKENAQVAGKMYLK
jgi:hypothetical protein